MLALLKNRTTFSKPTQHQSPSIFVSKRHNLAPKITINNDNQVLILSQEQSKKMAEALLDVAQAIEQAVAIHQGLFGLQLSLEQYRPLAESLTSTNSSINAVLGG